jgi:hypothetical protein
MAEPNATLKSPDAPELVHGVGAIADVLNTDKRRAYYLLSRGEIPGARKLAGKWCLSLPVFRREVHGDSTP